MRRVAKGTTKAKGKSGPGASRPLKSQDQPNYDPISTRKASKGLTIRLENLGNYNPITQNQEHAAEDWKDGYNLMLSGSAGTGKTYLAMHFGLEEVLDRDTVYDKVIIIRSVVPTRDMGFLPGTEEEKMEAYTGTYKGIVEELTGDKEGWTKLTAAGTVKFESTSFIRGVTFNDAIIIVDEMQNLNFHELDSVITRVGANCRIMFCGDYHQSDFKFNDEKDGIIKFLNIVDHLNTFSTVVFGPEDIVRSGLVKQYIMTKEKLGIS